MSSNNFMKSVTDKVEVYAVENGIERGSGTPIFVQLHPSDIEKFLRDAVDYVTSKEGREENSSDSISEEDIANKYVVVIGESSEASPSNPIIFHTLEDE